MGRTERLSFFVEVRNTMSEPGEKRVKRMKGEHMANLSNIRKAALLAPLVTFVFLSACTFDGGVPQPTGTVSPQPTEAGTPAPTEPGNPQPTGAMAPGDQGPPPAGGTRTGGGGTAQGVDLGLVALGGVIATTGAGLVLRRRLRA